jgi:hypothetical protein
MVADAPGYLGSVALLLWRNFGGFKLDWLQFFTLSAYATSLAGAVLTALAALYFHHRARRGVRDAVAPPDEGQRFGRLGRGSQHRRPETLALVNPVSAQRRKRTWNRAGKRTLSRSVQ